jgi:hypothetical protein
MLVSSLLFNVGVGNGAGRRENRSANQPKETFRIETVFTKAEDPADGSGPVYDE